MNRAEWIAARRWVFFVACLLLGGFALDGLRAAEPAAVEKSPAEKKAATAATLAAVRQELAGLRGQLDTLSKQGKYVDVARVYLAAMTWSADDVGRCLEAEEPGIAAQAGPLLADLQTCAGQPRRVLDRVLDSKPREDDPYHVAENPYFKSVVSVAQGQSRRETAWPKGRKGYLAFPNAWTFAGLGNNVFDAVWSMLAPQSSLRHHPVLLANALNTLDAIAHQHADGDFNVDRTAVHGRDPNINRFCLAPALDAWWRLRQAYPDLLPPAKQADLDAGLKRLADYQRTDYGLARLAKEPHVKYPAYPNMDVHYILIMELAHRLWADPAYARERDAFVKILDSAVYPRGAFAYINTQNECFVYHQLDVIYSARFWQLTGNPGTLAMLRRTIPYYPENVEPAGMPEYYTDACWKHYWGGGSAAGPDVIAALFDDSLNRRVAQTCGEIAGYGHGHVAAIAAEFWKPLPAQPQADGYTFHDANIDGPRGRYDTWSFAGNGRNYGVGYQGKDTFVGCMVTDPAGRPLPLDAALQVVTIEVRLKKTENHWNGGRCCSALEKLSTTLGPDFGSLAVRYTVSRPNWHHKNDELLPWEGVQTWYISKTRLVGLLSLEATADETRAGVYGRVRLGLSRTIESDGPQTWKYGRLRIKLHEHNFARVETRPSETFFLDKPENYHSAEITLLDPRSAEAGEKASVSYPKGTRYTFLVEAFPEGTSPAEHVQRIEEGTVTGFSFHESGRQVVVLHNPTDTLASCRLPLPAGVGEVTLYADSSGKGSEQSPPPASVALAAHQHLVAVVSTNERKP